MADEVKKKKIGRCIYCGSTDNLTDEHAAPEGIRGTHVLEDASCEACRLKIDYFEGVVLHGMLRPVREHRGVVGKRHKKRNRKRGPTPLFVWFENSDGTKEKIPLVLPAHPYRLVMPEMDPPGILMGRQRNEGFPRPGIRVRVHTHEAALRRMRELEASDPKRRNLIEIFDFGSFAKFLAKIGYCFAVYFLDIPFEPLVTELILLPREDDRLGPFYVGGPFDQDGVAQPAAPSAGGHQIHIRPVRVGEIFYVVARIWLFHQQGMPVYDVVVGTVDASHVDFLTTTLAAEI